MSTAHEFEPGLWLRGIAPPLRLRDFGLAAFDMDSTLINIECIDEIAGAAGRKAEVAAITEAAMRGEITDFKDSLRRRLALLRGVPVQALEDVYAQRLQLNPGVEAFVGACRAAGLKTLLVSGGFTFFSERVRSRLQIDFARANVLEIADGRLTGALLARPWGEIVDGQEKKRVLLEVAELMGLSIAFHAKPAVRDRAMLSITEGGLDRALSVLLPG